MFTQKLAQLNKELQRDNDSVLSSKTKVRLEAQIIQTRKQAIVCADTSTKLQYLRELQLKLDSTESKEQMEDKQQSMKADIEKLTNELNLYKQMFGLHIIPKEQEKNALSTFSIEQTVGNEKVVLVPNVKVEQLGTKTLQLSFDNQRKMSQKARNFQSKFIAGLQHE